METKRQLQNAVNALNNKQVDILFFKGGKEANLKLLKNTS